MILKTKEIEASLLKKGFQQTDNDHRRFYFYFQEKKTPIQTKISHSEKEIGAPLISAMSKDCHLSKNEFCDLVECSLSKEGYEVLLKKKEVIADLII